MTTDNPPFKLLRSAFQQAPRDLLRRNPGILPVAKPGGCSSHDIVARARRALGMRKIGHAGTLDPLAEGVLLLMIGQATRLFDDIQTFPKTYVATLRLGERTDTQDIEGTPVPGADPSALPLPAESIGAALLPFAGDIMQTPPMYSALKQGGKKLYELARAGETVERTARPVHVYSLQLLDSDGTSARLEMTVSSGFYVRTLIDDLGQSLGVGAVMTALTRTRIGPFGLDDCVSADDIRLCHEGSKQ